MIKYETVLTRILLVKKLDISEAFTCVIASSRETVIHTVVI